MLTPRELNVLRTVGRYRGDRSRAARALRMKPSLIEHELHAARAKMNEAGIHVANTWEAYEEARTRGWFRPARVPAGQEAVWDEVA